MLGDPGCHGEASAIPAGDVGVQRRQSTTLESASAILRAAGDAVAAAELGVADLQLLWGTRALTGESG